MKPSIRIDGEIVEPAQDQDVVEHEPGVYSVLLAGRSYEVRRTADTIDVNQHRMHWERDDPRQWKGAGQATGAKGRVSVKAPMPGKVIKLLTEVGHEVKAGQGILLMEAMKMQNELKSPKAGRVVSLHAQPLDSVTAGTILAVIE